MFKCKRRRVSKNKKRDGGEDVENEKKNKEQVDKSEEGNQKGKKIKGWEGYGTEMRRMGRICENFAN